MPNLVGPILVYSTLAIPNNILGEAGLSYLGVGVPPARASWGKMLSDAGQYFTVDPMYLFVPGIAVVPDRPGVQPVRRRSARRAGPEVVAMSATNPISCPSPNPGPGRRPASCRRGREPAGSYLNPHRKGEIH